MYKATYDDAALTIAGEMNIVMPERYTQAVAILKEMNSIDECKEIADRMEALAVYWRQANDEEMENLARRLRIRAYRRVGELLKEFDARGGNGSNQYVSAKSTLEDTFSKTQSEIAEEAGLSKKQQVTAVRLATIPQDSFEEQIEVEKVPTITTLADHGIRKRMKEMNDSDDTEVVDKLNKIFSRPEYRGITDCLGHMAAAVDEQSKYDPKRLYDAAFEDERQDFKDAWLSINEWMEKFVGVQ